MAKKHYEIIFVGDFREPAFRSTTKADLIEALTAAGYQTGLLQLAADRAGGPARIHEHVRALIQDGRLTHLDPNQSVTSKLLVATDPACFTHKPRRFLGIDTQDRQVLMSRVPTTPSGRVLYDWTVVQQNAKDVLGGEVHWAPTSPAMRERLRYLEPAAIISDVDWYDCINAAAWRTDRSSFRSSRPVIGRSGPASIEIWSDDAAHIMALYPDDPRFMVRILNGGPILRRHIGAYPRNWEVLTSETMDERAFLSSIDFFVYGHHADHADSVDPSLLKAMASGAVAVLPPSMKPLFGEGAVYAEPHEVRSLVMALFADRDRYLALSEAGRKVIDRSFSHQAAVDRTRRLIGDPDGKTVDSGRVSQTSSLSLHERRRVMFITINGVGMGHLTRMLAIAKRCAPSLEPVFVTMSQGMKVLREQGHLAEFIPSRQYLNCDINQWNNFLRDELNEMMAFYDPAVVVFDGNVPYQGLIDCIKANPDPWFIWSRRGMWRLDNSNIVGREKHFDVVLEPGDLASADDHGITKRFQDRTHHVGPIRLLDTDQMMPRAEARRELGMDPEKRAVLIQLGAGNNFDFRSIHNTALTHIQNRHDVQIAFGEWLISDQPVDLPDAVFRMPGYPFARYFHAFDYAISAVGYNSFHELLFAGIPTILVPNEATEQDNQLARALFADRHGLALCVRTKEIYRLTTTIDKLLATDEADRIASRLAELNPNNGALEAAALIQELAYSRRVDRP